MKYLVRWFDLEEEAVDTALVSYFHAVRLMKGEGVEESTASLCLCHAVKGFPLKVATKDGYVLTLEKVEG